MSAPTPKVELIHPITGATAKVTARAVPVHEATGWLEAGEYHRRHQPLPERPKNGDIKGVWVDYAVALGWDTADAEAFNKDDLIEELDEHVARLEADIADDVDDDTDPAGDGTDTESQED